MQKHMHKHMHTYILSIHAYIHTLHCRDGPLVPGPGPGPAGPACVLLHGVLRGGLREETLLQALQPHTLLPIPH